MIDRGKVGILVGSLICGVAGALVLLGSGRSREVKRESSGARNREFMITLVLFLAGGALLVAGAELLVRVHALPIVTLHHWPDRKGRSELWK